jgi:uncharacterized peroxidase-related enzyme
MNFPLHTVTTAPEESRELLAGAQKAFGFVPNLLATMAGAPSLLAAYLTLTRIFDESSLSPTERQLVLLTVSYQNECAYCMAAHTAIAGMQHVPAPIVDAVRTGRSIVEPRLEALRQLTLAIVQSRGWPPARTVDTFIAAGYSSQQVLEVVLGVGIKTMSNYTNHIAGTPLDRQFASAAWTRIA